MRLLSVENVCKRFGQREVLTGVSLHVDRGEAVCLMGPSGCGKTTLLRCVTGLERVDAGRIVVQCDLVGFIDPVATPDAVERAVERKAALILFDGIPGELVPVVEELAYDGNALIVATHDLGFACRAASRVALMDEGRVLEEGTLEQLLLEPAEPRTRVLLSVRGRAEP